MGVATRYGLVLLLSILAPSSSHGLSLSTERDNDDPKIERDLRPAVAAHPKRGVPRFKMTYRYLPMPSPLGGTLHFHSGGIDVYPLSHYVRIGLGIDGGYAGGPLGAFYATASAAFGLQYPSWATPFVEGRFAVGIVAGQVQGQLVPSLLYVAGVEGGVEFYLSRRFYVSGALGWVHPMFKSPDMVAMVANPTQPIAMKHYQQDAFTMKFGLGF